MFGKYLEKLPRQISYEFTFQFAKIDIPVEANLGRFR